MNKKKNMTTQLLWIVSGHSLWLNLTGCQMSTGFIKCHWELLQAAGKPSRHCIIRVNYIFVCFFFSLFTVYTACLLVEHCHIAAPRTHPVVLHNTIYCSAEPYGEATAQPSYQDMALQLVMAAHADL